jgi:hypothetical protein
VSHREADLLGGGHQRVALVDVEVPAGDEVVRAEHEQQDPGEQEASVHEHGVVARDRPGGDARRSEAEVEVTGNPTAVVVREDVGADPLGRVEVVGQGVGDVVVPGQVVGHGAADRTGGRFNQARRPGPARRPR